MFAVWIQQPHLLPRLLQKMRSSNRAPLKVKNDGLMLFRVIVSMIFFLIKIGHWKRRREGKCKKKRGSKYLFVFLFKLAVPP